MKETLVRVVLKNGRYHAVNVPTLYGELKLFLKRLAPEAFCDRCLSEIHGSDFPHAATKPVKCGVAEGLFIREVGICEGCEKKKVTTRWRQS